MNSLNTYNNLFEEIFAGLWSPVSSAYKVVLIIYNYILYLYISNFTS